jgi:hypothetical protein
MGKYQEFTRKELYDLVWATPMTKLAKRFGISDVGLRKICVKHDIPTPPLGYWAKLNFGKSVERAALGTAGDNIRDKVLVALSAAMDLPEAAVTAEVEAREIYTDPIKVPIDPPKDLHPVARATSRALRSAKPDDNQFRRDKRAMRTSEASRRNVVTNKIDVAEHIEMRSAKPATFQPLIMASSRDP